ncbi:MAG: hypothetical protein HQK92_12625 [Nitrospirae bacterium]|nr:hypothetical protein [Nitrospirota bacterium]
MRFQVLQKLQVKRDGKIHSFEAVSYFEFDDDIAKLKPWIDTGKIKHVHTEPDPEGSVSYRDLIKDRKVSYLTSGFEETLKKGVE